MTTPIFDHLHAEFRDAGRITLGGDDDVLVPDVAIPAQAGPRHTSILDAAEPAEPASPAGIDPPDDWHGPFPNPRD